MQRYKIVTDNQDGTYSSYYAYGMAGLIYEIGVPTRTHPWLEDSKLYPFVFVSILDALSFSEQGSLFLCETTNEMEVEKLYAPEALAEQRFLVSVWGVPPGSLMAETVTLIRKVTQEEIYAARKAARKEMER